MPSENVAPENVSSENRSRRLGLIVNPLAGVGGKVGLKGSDGSDTVDRALALGAVREAPRRAEQALARLARLREHVGRRHLSRRDGRGRSPRLRVRAAACSTA